MTHYADTVRLFVGRDFRAFRDNVPFLTNRACLTHIILDLLETCVVSACCRRGLQVAHTALEMPRGDTSGSSMMSVEGN